MAFAYTSKIGSGSFARKLARLLRRGRHVQARRLLQDHEQRFGRSIWNPGYGILPECGPSRDIFGAKYP